MEEVGMVTSSSERIRHHHERADGVHFGGAVLDGGDRILDVGPRSGGCPPP